ncbi:MAG: branched-chain amino acid ABC transporter permease [Magnetovibrionaceae bacterium]
MLLIVEQLLNGLQLGVMLFLLSAGLTLVFGIMQLINLAHGSLYMVGAYVTATVAGASGSFVLGLLCGVVAAAMVGLAIEALALRRLYDRDHLDQVLATFGIILTANEATKMIWGAQALFLDTPDILKGTVELLPGLPYPLYRLAIIGAGLLVALGLFLLITRTRTGMRLRAGALNREILSGLGVDVDRLFTLVFALGAGLAGLAGALAGPLLAIQVGMGEDILILAFVVIIVGGVGSVRGALYGAILVGLVDTLGRAFLPSVMREVLAPGIADAVGASLAGIGIYLFMALVLIWRPTGLFPAKTG